MVRARIRRRRVAAVLIGTVLALAVPAASRALSGPAAESPTYVVRPGDTVWSIALRVSPGSDPRRLVDAIVRTNGIDPAHLVPGQELRLPA